MKWAIADTRSLDDVLAVLAAGRKVFALEEAARREAWLDERRGTGGFMKDFAKGLNRFISRGQITPGWVKRHQRLAAVRN
ncbi:MAG: hypothetical protein QGG75_20620, partial [Alphaproteobacteria bacterium]|nr:hypothetical protein [Alphaproteobacteria bacterium]